MSMEAELRQGLAALSLPLSDEQVSQLLAYLELLQKWNRVYNLTAVRDPQQMLTHHLLDSLAAVPSLLAYHQQYAASSLLDVGSGGGLPGVVFAICCPKLQVHCVDTVGKKAAFIQTAATQLRLPNLKSIHARVEQLQDRYDLISSRAFATLADFTAWSRQALADNGCWMSAPAAACRAWCLPSAARTCKCIVWTPSARRPLSSRPPRPSCACRI